MLKDNIFDATNPFSPSKTNAENCSQSNKKIIHQTVYCTLLEQWVSVNYCENQCRAYVLKETIS